MRIITLLILASVLLAACSLPTELQSPEQNAMATIVALTLQAYTPEPVLSSPQAPLPTATGLAVAGFGSVGGGIYGYPKEKIPSLTVVAFSVDTPYWYYFVTLPGSSYYSIDILPPGTYHVVAYDDLGNRGGFTSGGALVDVAVVTGKTSPADINDWSGSFPPSPLK